MATYNNYLFINKNGSVFRRKSTSWSYILNAYVRENVGFESTYFKLDKDTWYSVSDLSNEHISNVTELDMFNALCTRSKLRIQAVFYGYQQVFPDPNVSDVPEAKRYTNQGDVTYYATVGPTASIPPASTKPSPNLMEKVTSYGFITANGRWYIYNVKNADEKYLNKNFHVYQPTANSTRTEDNGGLLYAINKYVTDNLGYSTGFTVTKATWDKVTLGEYTNGSPKVTSPVDIISLLNALCKRSKDRLAAVVAFGSRQDEKGNGTIYKETAPSGENA